MLQALGTQNSGYGIIILSTVGAYHAPGQDVRRAVGQFNAMADGLELAGKEIKVILYADSAAAGSLGGEDNVSIFRFRRRNVMEKFQYASGEEEAAGTYTSHTDT
jgi:hypothetical protein